MNLKNRKHRKRQKKTKRAKTKTQSSICWLPVLIQSPSFKGKVICMGTCARRSNTCWAPLPYQLKQQPCWELSAFTWPLSQENTPPKKVTNLTWPLSSAPFPVSHDPTSAEVQSYHKQCPTHLIDFECVWISMWSITQINDASGMKAYLAQLIPSCLSTLFRFRWGLVWKVFTCGILRRCKVNPLWFWMDLAPGSTWHDDVCRPCGPSSSCCCCC